MYKIINWYINHFSFPRRGWKYFRSFLKFTGLHHRNYQKRLHNGSIMVVNPSEHIQQQIFWYGYYEKEAVLTWESCLDNNSIVLDIGANTGYYTLVAAPLALKVYSFEPSSIAREQLALNVQLNGFKNVDIRKEAISNTEGVQDFYLSGPSNTGMSGFQPAENFSGTIEQVPVTSIDTWFKSVNQPRVDCVKIDVEGAEMKVLSGMKHLLHDHHPILFIEVIEDLLEKYKSSPAELYQFLEAIGYVAYEITGIRKLRRVTSPREAYTIIFLPANGRFPPTVSVQEQSE